MSARIIAGDCRTVLPTLESGSVQCCVTSPNYWGLRDFGHPNQMGLEATIDEYVEGLVDVFREVRRVLADDGTLWLNLGDTWVTTPNSGAGWGSSTLTRPNGRARKVQIAQEASMSNHRRFPASLQRKQLLGVPWRVAFALQDDGWILRSEVIWQKPTAMPESVRDRPTYSHEHIFLLAKQARYFYDRAAIAEPSSPNSHSRGAGVTPKAARVPSGWDTGPGGHRQLAGRYSSARPRQNQSFSESVTDLVETRNKRSVWTIPPEPYHGDHTGAFPTALAETCILAGSRPGDLVLDPFSGTGRTGRAALQLGRHYVGVELNAGYAMDSVQYIRDDAPQLNTDVELIEFDPIWRAAVWATRLTQSVTGGR